ncbi:MAG: alanine--tRNA ligase [Desulfuromonadales bacterium]|nr:alanine--tRNA ligase [Desulfuromonadales bacterium]
MTGKELRSKFLEYFKRNGHTIVKSSGLIPHNDPTLLFTNAGMNQFKDCFLGIEKRDYVRATSSQKCVRAGGKHNDLENVGRTARHHTFFEMLGNFSFGDYFKKEAIAFAWQFLTEELKLDKNRLYVTVYTDDDEAADIWHLQEGVPKERIYRFGEKDNFWSMGDTGPCGPCSEIFWDNGPDVGCNSPTCGVGCDCDRYMEIWNNVFMQYNRDASGNLTPLPKPSVDTGMGLERIATVMQGVKSNYDTDLLQGIIQHIAKLADKKYGDDEKTDVSMRVIADHSRAIDFLICDGVLPSNEGRGYVLRRIMRRAARHCKMLGFAEPVLYKTIDAVNSIMGEAFPELLEREEYIRKVILAEEERFAETLDRGLAMLNEQIELLKSSGNSVLPGEEVFRLYDTYGFPVDLTADIMAAENISIDEDGFNLCMERQRNLARENWKGSGEEGIADTFKTLHRDGLKTIFTGYREQTGYGVVKALIVDGKTVEKAKSGDIVELITESTPFYGTSGGQLGDAGEISTGHSVLNITETIKPFQDMVVHKGVVENGDISVGEAIDLRINCQKRISTARNHTATHLLQSALKVVLGDHVKQSGSLVTPERLRFDFTHYSAMTEQELLQVESIVNSYIMADEAVEVSEMDTTDAIASGATALFGEKYGDSVRVIKVENISQELCGGTHVKATGEIGFFKIISEAGIAAGVRRIEAVTGENFLLFSQNLDREQHQLASLLKAEGGNLIEKFEKLLAKQKELQKEVETLQAKLNAGKSSDLLSKTKEIKGVKTLAVEVKVGDVKQLRELADSLRDKMQSGILALGADIDGKATLLVTVTKDLTNNYKAGDLIRKMAPIISGSGGGKPEMAQAGGTQPEKLAEALKSLDELI